VSRVVLVVAGVIAVGAIVIAVLVAHHEAEGPSAPKTPDQRYLAAVTPSFGGVSSAILLKLGHDVCTVFTKHPSDPVAAEYQIASAASQFPKMPPASMITAMKAAVENYCPAYQSVLANAKPGGSGG
jgi:hypothetical protein